MAEHGRKALIGILTLILSLFPVCPGGMAWAATGDCESVMGKTDTAITSIMGKTGSGIATIMGKNYTDGDVAAPVYTNCTQQGTAEFYWNGDYTGGSTTTCDTDGTGTMTHSGASVVASGTDPGTESPDSGANALKAAAWNANSTVPITSGDIWSSAAGLMEFDIYLTSSSSLCTAVIAYQGATNYFDIQVNSNNTVLVRHRGNGTQTAVTSTDTVPDTTWTRVQVRWSVALDDLGIKIGAGSFKATTDTPVTAFSTEPAVVSFGNDGNGNDSCAMYLDNIKIWTTYDGS